MTSEETAWLAGLLEGEGSFCLDATGRRKRPSLVLSLQMCDEDVVARAAVLLSGNCIPSKRRKVRPNESPSWRVKVTGAKAEAAMLVILPHMGLRRAKKIQELLDEEELSHR